MSRCLHPTELIENQATDFVREFIGIERIDRQRNFGQRPIKEFARFFDETWTGEVREVDFDADSRRSNYCPGCLSDSRLAVAEDGVMIGYIGHHSLLQASMDNGKWVKS